ncbi:lipopolysaccharide assembly protein LapA domain-containing protein [Amorphus orientalis]|uniref:Integral membrane protein n=1 Tax=Amorphus orientalis TaxID=649198 RepID=A0AAE3VKM4_9HYPH|nr:lipopolysaccharide assembly protein LapA domain-containing protein [Amorphus orientalis]MDQ0314184.1 putative integral membrane protein [Amorphus orientalis]
MKRFLETLVLLPIAIILVILAVANRSPVRLVLDPFRPSETALSVTLPLYWVIFACLAIGVILGGMAVWMRQGRFRKAARRNRREAAHLREEVETIKKSNAPEAPALPSGRPAPLGLTHRA